jgi:hypothetical protein
MRYANPKVVAHHIHALKEAAWVQDDFDGAPILMSDMGGTCCTVFPLESPISWSLVIIPMDDVVGGSHFVIEGTAPTVEEAKAAAKNPENISSLLDKTFGYLLGEVKLGTGPSWMGRDRGDDL